MPRAARFGIPGVLLFTLLSDVVCSEAGRGSPEESFLRRYANSVQPLERKVGLRLWQASFSSAVKVQERLARAERDLADFYADPGTFNTLRAFRDRTPADPQIRRQIDILYNLHWPYQAAKPLREACAALEKDLGQEYSRLRLDVHGEDMSLEEGQRRFSDSRLSGDRRDYWEALLKSLKPLDAKFRRLASVRNQVARDLGFPNYFDQMLATNGLDKAEFLALLDELETRSAIPIARAVSDASRELSRIYGIREGELHLWHWPDPFNWNKGIAFNPDLNRIFQNKDHIRIGLNFFRALDIDLTAVVERSELNNKRAKELGAFKIFVDREYDYSLLLKPLIRWEGPPGYDVRIVLNVSSEAAYMERLLHQFGHAAYLENIDKKLPLVLRQETSTAVSEGVATFFGNLIYDAAWVQSFVPASLGDARDRREDLRRLSLSGILFGLRQKLFHLRFEQALYSDPEQDLSALWRSLGERFLMVRNPESWDNPDYLFYEDFVKWPVFEQHFIYGFLVCAQLRHALEMRFSRSPGEGGELDWPAVGRFFKEKIFSLGATYPWPTLVEMATGEGLKPDYFLSPYGDHPK